MIYLLSQCCINSKYTKDQSISCKYLFGQGLGALGDCIPFAIAIIASVFGKPPLSNADLSKIVIGTGVGTILLVIFDTALVFRVNKNNRADSRISISKIPHLLLDADGKIKIKHFSNEHATLETFKLKDNVRIIGTNSDGIQIPQTFNEQNDWVIIENNIGYLHRVKTPKESALIRPLPQDWGIYIDKHSNAHVGKKSTFHLPDSEKIFYVLRFDGTICKHKGLWYANTPNLS